MSIDVHCKACGSTYRVTDQWAGKKAKCAKCSSPIAIPAPVGQSAATERGEGNPKISAKEILAAIGQEVPRVPVSFGYRIAMLCVAVAVVLLPLAYFALIGLIIYLMYWHATSNTFLLSLFGPSRLSVISIIIYALPLCVGAAMVFFMIASIAARQERQGRIRTLTRDSDPLLYAFVERVSRAVGAPVPMRINVNCDNNASASLGDRLWALFRTDQMVLEIGLTLVAGLDLRQFTAVIAHELGHFSQDAGMRLFWVIAHVNQWFARIVEGGVAWEERCAWQSGWLAGIGQMGISLSRRILWCFMMLARLVSSHLSRHMEYDADRKAASLVGSEASVALIDKLNLLDCAQQQACLDLDLFFADGRLADNLPRLVVINTDRFDEAELKKIKEIGREEKAGIFSTHPSIAKRIESIRRLDAPCQFAVDQPSTVLFGCFDSLAQAVTLDLYHSIYGPKFDRSKMHEVGKLVARRDREAKAGEALDRFLLGQGSRVRPIRLAVSRLTASDQPRKTAEQLKAAREELKRMVQSYSADCEQIETAYHRISDAVMAKAAYEVGCESSIIKELTNKPASRGEAVALFDRATQDREVIRSRLIPFEEAIGRRMIACLKLLGVEMVNQRIKRGPEWFAECRRLLPTYEAVEKESENINIVFTRFIRLLALVTVGEHGQTEAWWVRRVLESTEQLHEQMVTCRQALFYTPYGLDHTDKTMTVGRYLVANMPPPDEPGQVYEAAESMLDRYFMLRDRLRARMAIAAEKVEAVLGLEPLPMGPKRASSSVLPGENGIMTE